MSHDRGCYKCFREPWEYSFCTNLKCPKLGYFTGGGDAYFAPEYEDDYQEVSERYWVEYEFATIEYDYNINPKAAAAIRSLFDRLERGKK